MPARNGSVVPPFPTRITLIHFIHFEQKFDRPFWAHRGLFGLNACFFSPGEAPRINNYQQCFEAGLQPLAVFAIPFSVCTPIQCLQSHLV